MTDEEKNTCKIQANFPLNDSEWGTIRFFVDPLGRTWESTEDGGWRPVAPPPKSKKPYWDIRLTEDEREEMLDLIQVSQSSVFRQELVESLEGPPHGHYPD